LSVRSVLITGCSSGIGLCCARGLKQRGYRVFAGARKHEDVEQLLAEGFEAVQLDLANSSSIDAAVDEILYRTNADLYGLFNNGAYGQPGAIEDLSRAALREQFEVNLFGTHELTNRVIPVMRRQGGGRIIQNSSILGFMALKYRGAYIASKFALEGLTDTLRIELADTAIHVSLIEPGPILSEFRNNALAMLRKHIDMEHSVHRDTYTAVLAKLKKEGAVVPFTLGPEAVLDRLIHALESPRPKIRYAVTKPTYAFAVLKRLLPARMMDRLLIFSSGQENRPDD
jgi:NAD(P)-dependent dehydrogenase (short-subunit alcohol dehydrogenase family)